MIVDIAEAAERLSAGEVVAYPTETVYGLGADARSPNALARLYALKGRAADHAVSILIEDATELVRLVPELPVTARALAARFWPGSLTLVVPLRADPAKLGHLASERGVGFRCSPHPTATALAAATPFPIVSTSCNRSGAAPCETEADVVAAFGDALAVAGGLPAGRTAPSTVVAIDTQGRVELLREGALPWAELENQGAA